MCGVWLQPVLRVQRRKAGLAWKQGAKRRTADRRSPRTTSLWPQPPASPPSPLGNGLPCAAVAARERAAVGLRFTRPGRLGLSCACAPETDVVACVQVEMFTTLWMWRQEYQHHEQLPLAFNGTWPSWNSDLDNRPW